MNKAGVTLPPAEPLIVPGIAVGEYQARRERVLEALAGRAGVVFAGDGGGHGKFAPDSHFRYLTGIVTEPGAAVLFNPCAEDPTRRVSLFLKPMNPERERWERYRGMISGDLKRETGFESAFRTDDLAMHIMTAARMCRKLACLHGVSSANAGVPADLALFRKVSERMSGVSIEDHTQMLPQMRSVKSRAELELMRGAAKITAGAYAAALGKIRSGASEREVERALETGYLDGGADATVLPGGHAYSPIVGSGLNATLLHYNDNDRPCREGDLLLIDSGARFNGYCCDVTRTYPVSGRFTPAQRELYELVLEAMEASIRVLKPGAYMWQANKAARDVIDRAGLGDAFMHGIGHQLGLDVHDASPDGPLKAGMVVTIEPGVYLPGGYKGSGPIGIRIEDDIVIGAKGKGVENLTASIPKDPDEIERAMAGTAPRSRSRR
ncbi:MAG: Xaa-Pro peptidase family protein [Phycisphaerales bacterium]|nr:Xaa-Pro peptidase family protein [Phycisphaerales bacterium]